MADDAQTLFDSSFGASDLTAILNQAGYQPGFLAGLKLFREIPMSTTLAEIERVQETLRLVQSAPRGAPVPPHVSAVRDALQIRAPHLRTESVIRAASWQDRRGFGTAALASVEGERDRLLAEHRRRIEATIEYHRTRALSGVILDADGSVLVDLLAEFGVAQNAANVTLSVATSHIPNAIVAAKRLAEAELGDARPSGWIAVSSAGFLDAMRAHPSISAALAGWQAATMMRDDVREDMNVSSVRFTEVRNTASTTWVEADCAYLVPLGIPDLFVTSFAPADFVETANTPGQPLYAKAELLSMGRGIRIESQSNPVSIVTRPRAVVKLVAA